MKHLHWMSLLIPSLLLLSTGCASVFSKSRYPVQITSHPSAANFTITNSKGRTVYSGRTPAAVSLRSSEGFFRAAHYSLKFSKIGYEDQIYSIRSTMDGWYVGNIFWGLLSPLGFLIIDPATGAMFRLDEQYVSVALNESMLTTEAPAEPALRLMDLADIPDEWKPHLLQIEAESADTK